VGRSPLFATDDLDLMDDVLRLSSAAQIEPEVAGSMTALSGRWSTAGLIVLGADVALSLSKGRLPVRREVIIVARAGDDVPQLWRVAVDIGADLVAIIPEDEGVVVDRLVNFGEAGVAPGDVIAVVGACGGSGASTVGAALAVSAARTGCSSALVDLDPLGAGSDVILGGAQALGLNWADLAQTKGRVPTRAISDGLPVIGGVSVLTRGPRSTPRFWPGAAGAAVDALTLANALTVLDVPRESSEHVNEALARAREVLIVVPPDLRALASASRMLASGMLVGRDPRVVINSVRRGGMARPEVEVLLGRPVFELISYDGGLTKDLDAGLAPAWRSRSTLRKASQRMLAAFGIGVPR